MSGTYLKLAESPTYILLRLYFHLWCFSSLVIELSVTSSIVDYGKKKTQLVSKSIIFRWLQDCDATSVSLTAISVKRQLPLPVLFGQATFINGETLAAIGHEQTPEGRLFGLKFCQNRPSGMYIFKKATDIGVYTATRLTSPERSCRSVGLSPDRKNVYFLSNRVFGAHASCASLHEYSLESNTIRAVVDTVLNLSEENDDSFPGLYIDQLPPQPFVYMPHNKTISIVTQSIWRSNIDVLVISIDDRKVINLTAKDRFNWTVLTTADKWYRFVCAKCTINEPPELVLGNSYTSSSTDWITFDKPQLSQDGEFAPHEHFIK